MSSSHVIVVSQWNRFTTILNDPIDFSQPYDNIHNVIEWTKELEDYMIKYNIGYLKLTTAEFNAMRTFYA